MQNKHLCVSIHIWTKDEVGAQTRLSHPVKYFTDCSKVVFLLWIIYVISVLFCYAFMHVCLMPCGHLLGKGRPLGSRLWCLIVTLSLSQWYLGSGVVLDCIDSWSLPSFLLNQNKVINIINFIQYSLLFLNFLLQRILELVFYGDLIYKFKRSVGKVRKVAKIRNRYHQVPHLTQNTTWESDKTPINITNKRQGLF